MAETQTGSNTGAQGASGGSNSEAPAQGAGAAVAARGTTAVRREEQNAHTERMIAKYGTLEKALDAIGAENYDYREAARQDAQTITTLRGNQVPKGAVVLTGDDVKHWEKVTATGVPLDKIAGTLERAKVLEAERVKVERATKHAAVANAAGFDPEVLTPLVEQFGFEVDTQIVKVSKGDKVVDETRAMIRKAGDDKAPWEPLNEFVKKDGSQLKPFEVALRAKGTSSNGNGSTRGGDVALSGQGGTTHTFAESFATSSAPASNGGGEDFLAKRINARNEAADKRTNPLRQPAPAKK